MDYYNGLLNGMILPQRSGLKWDEITDGWDSTMHKVIMNLPEFDFYTGNNYDLLTSNEDYIHNVSVYNTYLVQCRNELVSVARLESKNEYASACKIYEGHVMENTWNATFYIRLAKIYHLADLFPAERKLLDFGVDHLTAVREKMMRYVTYLGKKYGSIDYVNKRIAENKKIVYYDGLFDLYNPYPEIDELQKMSDALK